MIPLMDALDQKERATAEKCARARDGAMQAIVAGAYETAALLFDECAEIYTAEIGLLHHRTKEYRMRAVDCRSLLAIKNRRRKGGTK